MSLRENPDYMEPPPGGLVLTPNQAIADSILLARIRNTNDNSIEAESVVSLRAWLRGYLNPASGSALASELQLLALWEDVISNLSLPFDLHPRTLAPLALQGWLLIKQWRVNADDLNLAEYGQDERFSRWCSRFDKRLEQVGLTTLELLAESRLQDAPKPDWDRILIAGFVQSPAPLWSALIDTAANETKKQAWGSHSGDAHSCVCETPADEIGGAAEWASRQLHTDPGKRIAIIAPQGRDMASRLERELLQRNLTSVRRKPLSEAGLVSAAFTLLQVNSNELTIAEARQLVQSPFWGNPVEEASQRSNWERRLCALERRAISHSDLRFRLQDCNRLLELLELIRLQPDRQSPLAWADSFQTQLELLGWPGKRDLTPEQISALDAWLELLGDLASLGAVSPIMDFAQVRFWLQRAAEQRALVSEGTVFLLDRIEEAVDFDHIWLLGCDDQHWPPPPKPHPLIPYSIQRRYEMPRSSTVRELALCEHLLATLQSRCPDVIFSFARSQEEQPVRLTPLLDHLPEATAHASQTKGQENFPGEWVECSKAPPLPDNQRRVKGGSRLLQTMAASPFDAFALFRLGAEPLAKPVEGISPREAGIVTHDLLERTWERLGRRQATLLKLSDSELEQLVSEEIAQTLLQWKSAWQYGRRQLDVLTEQLQVTLLNWLRLEGERDDFEVLEMEQNVPLTLGGIELSLRVDRVDRTAMGLLLIDYKTGRSGSIDDWLGSPPTQPQLPLYSIALTEPPSGLAFAKVREEECRWVALGATIMLPGMREHPDWAALHTRWHEELEALAAAYCDGDTGVVETAATSLSEDPLRALHRFDEFEDLMEWLKTRS